MLFYIIHKTLHICQINKGSKIWKIIITYDPFNKKIKENIVN